MFRGGSLSFAGMGGALQARLPGHLPIAGGSAEQSAWLMDAFAVMAAFEAEFFEDSR
ncbi:MAG: hypothetical protein AB7R90_19470 [Reyranellaceae bacterium]